MAAEKEVGQGSNVWEKFLATPIVRGAGGLDGKSKSWHICGTGRKVESARKMAEEGNIPKDFKSKFGADFVDEMCQTDWTTYMCLQCKSHI